MKRICLLLLPVLAGALVVCAAYLYLVPAGLPSWGNVIGYILLSVDRGEYASPDGTRTIRIVDLDGGATHSGDFRTFVIVRSWMRDRVIAVGWLSEPRGLVSVQWKDERHVVISFSAGESVVEVP